jgi:DNA-binding NarL/FixJ family response regulator
MTRLLIVDDQNFTRQALQSILEAEPDFEVVGKAANGMSAIKCIDRTHPEILIVDLEMPQMNGLVLTKKVRQLFPQIKVIILSSHDDEYNIDEAVKAGVRGYLLKSTSAKEIVDTVRYVQRGYFQLGPGLCEKMLSHLLAERDNSADYITQLEHKYKSHIAELEQKIAQNNQQQQKQIFAEVDSQVNNLKTELRDGLEAFQSQVTTRLKNGLEVISQSYKTSALDSADLEKQIKERNFEQQRYINTFLLGTKQSIKRLEQQINFLRYFVIFLGITFFVEKLAFLMF